VSAKGKRILDALAKLNTQMAEPIMPEAPDIEAVWRILRRLERRWSDSVRFKSDIGVEDL